MKGKGQSSQAPHCLPAISLHLSAERAPRSVDMNGMDTACKALADTGARAQARPWGPGTRSLGRADPWAEHSRMSGEKLSSTSPRSSLHPVLPASAQSLAPRWKQHGRVDASRGSLVPSAALPKSQRWKTRVTRCLGFLFQNVMKKTTCTARE